MPIQYDADAKIPETILVPAAEGLGPDSACSSLSVSEFVSPHFSETEQKDKAEMTSLVPQARSNELVAFSG